MNEIGEQAEILVVEDSPTQAEKLKYVLEKNDLRVSIALSGKDALKLLKDHKPSIVISDVVMPEMDGYELCKHIKTDEKLKDIPVILLTALSDTKDVLRGLECGADNFITKPYDDGYLLSRINHILLNRELRKNEQVQLGVKVFFSGQNFLITSERQQILDLLLSTYETAVRQNGELIETRDELKALNEQLEQKVEERTAALKEEITERKRSEEELGKYRGRLEELVEQRTAELKKMTDELSRSNADLQQFAYAASHDLQEPLRGIAGFVGLLERRYKGKLDKKADEFIDYIIEDVKRMQMLIKDLLEYSRIDTKSRIFRVTNCSLVLEEAIYNLRSAIEESGTEVTYDLLPIVMGDASQLKRLFQNLIGNAIKFRSDKIPRIHISAGRERDDWVFSVRDNGIGIEPKYFARIFTVFQRLHTRDKYEGTGIGLAVCKKIVERHGGRIWVESRPGEGSTFYFTLPSAQ